VGIAAPSGQARAGARPPVPASRPAVGLRRWRRRARSAGIAVGLAIVAVALPTLRVDGGTIVPTADLTVRIAPSAELVPTSPTRPVLRDLALAGGDPSLAGSGTTTVRNQTGAARLVAVRAFPDSGDLDLAVRLRVSSGPLVLADETIGSLRAGTAPILRLGPGASAPISVRASMDPARAGEAGGRAVDVTLQLLATRAE
jgi:hypothetical protein